MAPKGKGAEIPKKGTDKSRLSINEFNKELCTESRSWAVVGLLDLLIIHPLDYLLISFSEMTYLLGEECMGDQREQRDLMPGSSGTKVS